MKKGEKYEKMLYYQFNTLVVIITLYLYSSTRCGLFDSIARVAEGVAAVSCTRFEKKDECVVGTAMGQVTLWKGRSCSNLVQAHKGPVNSLAYSASSGAFESDT